MMHAVTYQYNSGPPHSGGSGFREQPKGFRTEQPFEIHIILDRGSFLDRY